MKKLQQKIFNLGMACVFIFVGMLLYREPASESVFTEKKYVALTYDDGPSRLTTQALVELLNKYDASATFFINGNHANENKELVKHWQSYFRSCLADKSKPGRTRKTDLW